MNKKHLNCTSNATIVRTALAVLCGCALLLIACSNTTDSRDVTAQVSIPAVSPVLAVTSQELTPEPQFTSTGTAAANPTLTLTPSPPTPTPNPVPHVRIVRDAANVRSGPGTEYDVVAVLRGDQVARIVGSAPDDSWYEVLLETGRTGWIGSTLVEVIEGPAASEVHSLATATPSATTVLSGLEQDYLAQILSIVESWGVAFSNLGRLFGDAARSPALFFDEDWKLDLLLNLLLVSVSSQEMESVSAPARFTAVHRDLLSASRHYTEVSRLIAEGIDALNTMEVNVAERKFEEALRVGELGHTALRRAVEELEEYSWATEED
jgi:uncharacterized protein YgiM (DUF1202 family)